MKVKSEDDFFKRPCVKQFLRDNWVPYQVKQFILSPNIPIKIKEALIENPFQENLINDFYSRHIR